MGLKWKPHGTKEWLSINTRERDREMETPFLDLSVNVCLCVLIGQKQESKSDYVGVLVQDQASEFLVVFPDQLSELYFLWL